MALESEAAGARPRRTTGARSPLAVGTVVLVLGLLVTAAVTWATWSQYRDAEDRLLLVQTRQAAAVVAGADPSTQLPIETAAQLAASSGGDVRTVAHYLDAYIGTRPGFLNATVWRVAGRRVTVLAAFGRVVRRPSAEAADRIALAALRTPSFVVVGLLHHGVPRLGYADGVRGSKGAYVVYAERALPRDRQSRVSSNVAFSDIHYAIFLGDGTRSRDLLTSDFPGLYPHGTVDRTTVPFGTTTLTVAAAPIGSLAGDLPARRPWVIAAVGVALSIAGAILVMRLVRRRRAAERDAREISALNTELAELYAEQRTIALTLQRSLLPATTPEVPGLEVAVRYLPGAEGVEIGGDWYSVVAVDDRHVGFVVGDVAGRGVRAAAVMAELRFTIRTLLLEGHPPRHVLATCAAQTLDIVRGNLATALVGVVDLDAGTTTLASAGHLPPLELVAGRATFVEVATGVPLGAPGPGYEDTVVATPPGVTLLAFTDGLVERRGENLDVGLARLARSAAIAPQDLESFVSRVCDDLTGTGDEDDVAMLALRWRSDSPQAR